MRTSALSGCRHGMSESWGSPQSSKSCRRRCQSSLRPICRHDAWDSSNCSAVFNNNWITVVAVFYRGPWGEAPTREVIVGDQLSASGYSWRRGWCLGCCRCWRGRRYINVIIEIVECDVGRGSISVAAKEQRDQWSGVLQDYRFINVEGLRSSDPLLAPEGIITTYDQDETWGTRLAHIDDDISLDPSWFPYVFRRYTW